MSIKTIRPQVSDNSQTSFLPIDIIDFFPNDTGSADMIGTGIGNDYREYAIKQGIEHLEYIPAVELFCHELCRLLIIPTPRYEIVRLFDGKLAFGSQWDGGALPHSAEPYIQTWIHKELDESFTNFNTIGKIYGLDLFINNIDRHWNNYLLVKNRTTISTLAFDFGRALFNMPDNGYDGFDVFRVNEKLFANTGLGQLRFFEKNFHVHEAAEQTLNEISAIHKSKIIPILDKIPLEWLSENIRQDFLTWWGSDKFKSRIEELKSRGLAP
ncbi:hypothetical protein [Marinomonas sp.]|uniref:hypothetical protein n=1 Tax=Marinomonas sp. TaxID=1904862 RepID=UPI003BACC6C7